MTAFETAWDVLKSTRRYPGRGTFDPETGDWAYDLDWFPQDLATHKVPPRDKKNPVTMIPCSMCGETEFQDEVMSLETPEGTMDNVCRKCYSRVSSRAAAEGDA